MTRQLISSLFYVDALSIVMMVLVAFIGLCVSSFAWRYMKGDTKFRSFFIKLILLIVLVFTLVCADHLVLLFIAWCLSNVLLVQLMVHKTSWQAAKASGLLTARIFFLGLVCMAAALVAFYWVTGDASIQLLIHRHVYASTMLPALVLLLISAMTQSAIWPFHRWLISSLNSPTPVSALMHAGLVNGGGFLLIRFAPLYLNYSGLLAIIFVIGIISALLGTLLKLMQSDIKRMLACSTMGQMGFMLVQCGLGLFPAAVAHLVLHSMFKAYLFLASGGAAQEKRLKLDNSPRPLVFICALICGMVGSYGFRLASGETWLAGDTTFIPSFVAFLGASQCSLTLLNQNSRRNLLLALVAAGLFGSICGGNVYLIVLALKPMQLMQPMLLNGIHYLGIIVLALSWFSMLFIRDYERANQLPPWICKSYVIALNAGQPHPATVTVFRNQYKYL